MTTSWDESTIDYTDEESLREILVGRSIKSVEDEGSDYGRVLTFTLDDGTLLKAHATDGGCGCSNGCFSVDSPLLASSLLGTITNVEVTETVENGSWDYDANKYVEGYEDIKPGSVGNGEATIRLFVYTTLDKHLLVESEGGDNGYYGWGYSLTVHRTEVTS